MIFLHNLIKRDLQFDLGVITRVKSSLFLVFFVLSFLSLYSWDFQVHWIFIHSRDNWEIERDYSNYFLSYFCREQRVGDFYTNYLIYWFWKKKKLPQISSCTTAVIIKKPSIEKWQVFFSDCKNNELMVSSKKYLKCNSKGLSYDDLMHEIESPQYFSVVLPPCTTLKLFPFVIFITNYSH